MRLKRVRHSAALLYLVSTRATVENFYRRVHFSSVIFLSVLRRRDVGGGIPRRPFARAHDPPIFERHSAWNLVFTREWNCSSGYQGIIYCVGRDSDMAKTFHFILVMDFDLLSSQGANIFLTRGGRIKLGDFGCSAKLQSHTTQPGEFNR